MEKIQNDEFLTYSLSPVNIDFIMRCTKNLMYDAMIINQKSLIKLHNVRFILSYLNLIDNQFIFIVDYYITP